MSTIPSSIPDIGNVALLPTPNPSFDPGTHTAQLSAEDYFVFTRIDGATPLRQIILETGFAPERAIAILQKLRGMGAFLLPGETEPPVFAEASRAASAVPEPSAAASAAPPPSEVPASEATQGPGSAESVGRRPGADAVPRAVHARGTVRVERPIPRPTPVDERLAEGTDSREVSAVALLAELELTVEEQSALEQEVALSEEQKARVLVLRRTAAQRDYFALLAVEPTAKKRELKRAYFRVSKQFHPDRFYGKDLGAWAPWLSQIFEAASRAFDVLSDDRLKAEYIARRNGQAAPLQRRESQSREEHAAELFDQACAHELRGNHDEAVRLFGAVVRIDPRPRFLWRAAQCTLAAGQLDLAEEYAKKAAELQPNDPSYGRLLASVFTAAGNLADAESMLVHALSLITENDVLVGELQSDLANVRRRLEERD